MKPIRSCGSSWALTSFICVSNDCSMTSRAAGAAHRVLRVRRKNDDSKRAGQTCAHDAASLDGGMRHELALDRSRRHILALTGLKLLLYTPDDLHLAVRIELDKIAGAKEAILGKSLTGALRVPCNSQSYSLGS